MILAFILSYSWCVPNHTINTIFNLNSMSTINRNELPWILKITLLSEIIEALWKWDFNSFGLFHSAESASSCQANRLCFALGYKTHQSFNVLTAITRTIKYTYLLPFWLHVWQKKRGRSPFLLFQSISKIELQVYWPKSATPGQVKIVDRPDTAEKRPSTIFPLYSPGRTYSHGIVLVWSDVSSYPWPVV